MSVTAAAAGLEMGVAPEEGILRDPRAYGHADFSQILQCRLEGLGLGARFGVSRMPCTSAGGFFLHRCAVRREVCLEALGPAYINAIAP